MQAKLPMEDLKAQVSSGHGGGGEVSKSHGQSALVIPTVNRGKANKKTDI
jgi:hypothetical protein